MEIGYINGMNLGIGFNTATYDIHPTPALDNVLATRPVVNAGGQEVYFRVELASSTLSLTEQLSVTARASLKYGVTASGSAKTSFLSSFKQNSFSIYVLVQVLVTNEQTLLDLSRIELKASAATLFASNPQAFTQQYGDSFVYGLITGGEFLGVLEIESSSASEFREIKASLSGKASYGLFSGNAKATFEQSLQKITSSYQMKATILRRGSSGAVLTQVTPDNLVREALDFPSKVTGSSGFPYTALIIPYNHIPHPVASPLDVSNQMTVLEQLGAWRQRLLKYQNDLAFALDHPQQFPGLDVSQINDRYNKIGSEIANIVSSASACFTDQTRCALPSIDLTLLENVLPPQIEGVSADMVKIFVQSVVVGTGANPPSSAGSHDYTFTPPGSTRVLGGWWSLQDDASGSDAFKQFAIQGTTGTGGGDDVPTPNGNSITFRVKKQNNNSGLIRLAFYVAYV